MLVVRMALVAGLLPFLGCVDRPQADTDTEQSGDQRELGPCARVIDCATAQDLAVTPLLAQYGEDGTCWDEFPASACWQDCRSILSAAACASNDACCECEVASDCAYDPERTVCEDGSCVPDPGGGEPPTDFPPTDYLVLLRLSVAESTPLQLVGTIEKTDGLLTLDLEFLSLDVLSTDAPRQPTGTFLQASGVAVDEMGEFEFSLDTLDVVGRANPITGSDITLSLDVRGHFVSGMLCGSLDGMVTVPTSIDLSGSTLAAVPLENPNELPDVAGVTCD